MQASAEVRKQKGKNRAYCVFYTATLLKEAMELLRSPAKSQITIKE